MNDPNPELPDYVKPPYLVTKKKAIQDYEAGMFEKFKEMLTTLQVSILFQDILDLMSQFAKFMKELLKGTKENVVKE